MFFKWHGGTIIDFLQIKENLSSIREVLEYLGHWVFSKGDQRPVVESAGTKRSASLSASYDILGLYKRLCEEDAGVCRNYLLSRGIAAGLVDELIADGIVVHNRYRGQSYCCFAVRGAQGELQCLDNHRIDGGDKFVLGQKSIFTEDWQQLPKAEAVFVCEGVIDYLSVKTLEGSRLAGLALLGNQVNFAPSLLLNARVILSALDDDRGGYSAILDLQEEFPDKRIEMYDLCGHKDPNELLMAAGSEKGPSLSPKRKLELYQEFVQASNKSEVARRWGMDRSYLYEIAKDCDQILLDAFLSRRPGRKPEGKPQTLEQALQRIEQLEEKHEQEATERERLYCRSEFLQLRLKWAEIEAAQLRGEAVDEAAGPKKKSQIKKKKKRRHSR